LIFDPKEYEAVVEWLTANTGKIFSVSEPPLARSYTDSKGRTRRLEKSQFKNEAKLLAYIKHHIDSGDSPEVEFSDDYFRMFKIWEKESNFFNYPLIIQEQKNI